MYVGTGAGAALAIIGRDTAAASAEAARNDVFMGVSFQWDYGRTRSLEPTTIVRAASARVIRKACGSLVQLLLWITDDRSQSDAIGKRGAQDREFALAF
jgi:hypothetical protein